MIRRAERLRKALLVLVLRIDALGLNRPKCYT